MWDGVKVQASRLQDRILRWPHVEITCILLSLHNLPSNTYWREVPIFFIFVSRKKIIYICPCVCNSVYYFFFILPSSRTGNWGCGIWIYIIVISTHITPAREASPRLWVILIISERGGRDRGWVWRWPVWRPRWCTPSSRQPPPPSAPPCRPWRRVWRGRPGRGQWGCSPRVGPASGSAVQRWL